MDRARTPSGGGGSGRERRARPAPPPPPRPTKGGNVKISRSENNGGVVEWGERGREGDREEESLYVELEIRKAEEKCPPIADSGNSVNSESNTSGSGGVEFDTFDWEEEKEGEDRQVSRGRRVYAAKILNGGSSRWKNGLVNGSHVSSSPPPVTQRNNVAASSSSRRSVSFATDSVMGEEKRPPIVSVTDSASTAFAAKAAAPSSSSGQNNVRRGGNARHQLDSDGGSTSATSSSSDASSTASSVAESDSSNEEIHYGPGFVSRLKSRYMSVALRSSTRVALRRTASLENFLEKEKGDDHVELKRPAKNKPPADDNKGGGGGAGKGNYAKTPSSSSSSSSSSSRSRPPLAGGRAARATTRTSVSSKESMKRAQSIEVLSVNGNDPSAETTARIPRRPSTEAPPPLPPKSQPLPVDAAVSSLANDDIVIVEKSSRKDSSSGSNRKVSPGQDSLAGRPSYKRRSTSVLFGLAEKELPAPDTVKETRKIFESRSGGANGRRPGPFLYARNVGGSSSSAAMTKSRSTSSLYVRSQSVDQGASAAGRKASSSGDKKPAAVLATPKRTSSPATRKTSLQLSTDSSKAAASRKPSLPAKPTNVPSTTSYAPPPSSALKSRPRQEPPQPMQRSKSSSTFPIPPLRPVSAKKHAAEEPSVGDDELAVKTISNDAMANIRQGGSSVSFDFKGGRPNYSPKGDKSVGRQVGVIRPITRATTAEDKINNRVNSARSAKPLAGEHMAPEKEKEVLLIDKEQLVPLPKTYKALETAAATAAAPAANDSTDNVTTARRDEAMLVVAKPAMIQEDVGGDEGVVNDAKEASSPKLAIKPAKQKSKEAEPVPSPSPPPPVTTEVKKVISFGDEKKVISFGDEKEDGHKENAAKVQNGSATKQTVALDVNANANSSPPSSSSKRAASLNRAAESNSSDKEANGEDGGGGSYRDSWKQRQEQQNTMVFNFSNTKRDVTHIENDGRDISRRSKSKTKDKKKMIKQAEKAKVSHHSLPRVERLAI